jgi:UDP-N-acetylglucosamine diphosphorylase / glucose-1-phosphate thymidylyltransferase / UDP-N-acetylgalactosamine diphosphorylase / glucosamine-1-phosphate N-acetyltransferase / galactosamine-1-phosphate N-acetyltransferase
MNLIIFEDSRAENFYPISVSHPVFNLLIGCTNAIGRSKAFFTPDKIILSCREYLADNTRDRYGYTVNDFNGIKGETLLLNAAAKPDIELFKKLKDLPDNSALYGTNGLIGARLDSSVAGKLDLPKISEDRSLLPSDIEIIDYDIALFEYLWDMVNYNSQAIANDIEFIPLIQDWIQLPGMLKYGNNVYIHPQAKISPGVFIDDDNGPVVIDEGAVVESRTLIQGPAYIGKNSVLMAGMVREGCSIGPVCKVGGELEESIIMGYSNKCHEGFIGHSYLGEWVNLGALTTNSDLKNNYGEITVRLNGKDIKTGSIKVGSLIGDHTKTGIGTLLNTGVVIGFCNNLYGGELFADKEIGHFRWGTPGNLVEYRVDKAVEVAKAVMRRRKLDFGTSTEVLFNLISKM